MAEESSEELAWLLRPPDPGHVHLHVRIGEGVELTQEQRSALEALTKAFYEEEVEGFGMRCRPEHCEPRLTNCAIDWCGNYSCELERSFKMM
jgi:hypothetical protein